MYAVYLDGEILYSPGMHDKEREVIDPVLSLALNEAGSFTCKVPRGNALYGSISKMTSLIDIYDDQALVWRGRVLETTEDFYGRLDLYAEGALAFFNDTIVRPYSYAGSVLGYLEQLVDGHNAQADDWKRFQIGNVTVTDANDYITRESSGYPNTLEELKAKTVGLMGGYLSVREGQGGWCLDYTEESGPRSDQVIGFGENLLDLEQYISGKDVYTVIIPIGADGLTIASVNEGKDYIESAEGIALYGRIVRMVKWEDVTIAGNLLAKAEAELAAAVSLACRLTIRAADLSLLGVSVKALRPGMYNRVVSIPHGIDDWYQCASVELDLAAPAKSTYTFGMTYSAMADILEQQRQAREVIVNGLSRTARELEETAYSIDLMAEEVAVDYAGAIESLEKRVSALEEERA